MKREDDNLGSTLRSSSNFTFKASGAGKQPLSKIFLKDENSGLFAPRLHIENTQQRRTTYQASYGAAQVSDGCSLSLCIHSHKETKRWEGRWVAGFTRFISKIHLQSQSRRSCSRASSDEFQFNTLLEPPFCHQVPDLICPETRLAVCPRSCA